MRRDTDDSRERERRREIDEKRQIEKRDRDEKTKKGECKSVTVVFFLRKFEFFWVRIHKMM